MMSLAFGFPKIGRSEMVIKQREFRWNGYAIKEGMKRKGFVYNPDETGIGKDYDKKYFKGGWAGDRLMNT